MSAPVKPRTNRGPRGLRLSKELEEAVQREADSRGASWSAMAIELLEEAIRMRRVPGIAFVDGATGRRAVIGGSGVEVWEAIATFLEDDGNFSNLVDSYPWLSEMQLRSALAYYRFYPEEIDRRLEREAAWTPEQFRQLLPFAAPASADS